MSEAKRSPGRPAVGPRVVTKVEPELLVLLRDRADRRYSGNLSAAVRDLLHHALETDREDRVTA